MTELGRARAVIVIWTDASIKSDWVRSEAGRAQADRKLIPVKLPHLNYKDLPPPFDVLHTENVGEDDKIHAAVVAQLAKPAVEPSAIGLLTKGFKYELLTWLGIIGGALTLFTNLGAVIKLADWARLLVENWKEWTHAFWVWAFGWLGIHLPPEWTPVLSFLLFGSLLTIGQAVQFKAKARNQPNIDKYNGKSFHLISLRTFFCLISLLFNIVLLQVLILVLAWSFGSFSDWANSFSEWAKVSWVAFNFSWFVAPSIIISLFARHRLHAVLSAFLMATFSMIITFAQLWHISYGPGAFFSAMLISIALPLIILSVAPAKAISRRLIFLALGLLLLIALNELSKLGLDVTAPKQG
jgi:hypothetical protein